MSKKSSNEQKPSSDSPSDGTVVGRTTSGLLIKIADANPWRMAYGSWAEMAKVG